jgi:hypothetical protein
MRLVLAAAALLTLAACGQQQQAGYPPGYELNFMRACEPQSGIAGQCACVWDKIEAEVPAEEFAALDRMPGPQREAHPLMQQINGYAVACANQLQGEQTPAP